MRGVLKYACVMALPLLVAAGAAQAQTWPDGGNPSEGATLYDSCVPCHTLNGNGLAGMSVPDLMEKMKGFQTGTYTDGKMVGMQNVLKPLSDKQLLDLAAYINKM
ncbi:c-type cytochrome [uncultured Bilophila sp.]|uniref:c-type cytochrome n=1 Tax=uncultured Bilophila sp. TaxID=529385 RepID=UPI0025F16B20|nr:c-type cytochrome [uncultured Bilophila sp.]